MVEDLAGFIGIWLPTILLVAVGALLAWREPRRLLPGLLFTLATFQILIGVFGGALYFGQWLYPEVGGVLVVLGFLLFSVLGAILLGVFLIWNTSRCSPRRAGTRRARDSRPGHRDPRLHRCRCCRSSPDRRSRRPGCSCSPCRWRT